MSSTGDEGFLPPRTEKRVRRERIAAEALVNLLAVPVRIDPGVDPFTVTAKAAVMYADALIAELDKS